ASACDGRAGQVRTPPASLTVAISRGSGAPYSTWGSETCPSTEAAMADPTGFLRVPREGRRRTPAQRLRDWREVHLALPDLRLRRQAERCMGCGIPFCHEVCPLGNLIPEWNELVARGAWKGALQPLARTDQPPLPLDT